MRIDFMQNAFEIEAFRVYGLVVQNYIAVKNTIFFDMKPQASLCGGEKQRQGGGRHAPATAFTC
jgi:hypothetical protein